MNARCRQLLRRLAVLGFYGCCAPGFAATGIHGAGATFPAPVYAAWAKAWSETGGDPVQYDAVGSGQGIERIRRHEVDFGASDEALSPEDLKTSGLLQFPVIIGGVVPVINIRGIKPGALRLSGPLLADIYLGHIKKWNDPAIAQLNPSLRLPNANITVVHRSDSSGSSLLWADYLSRVSPEWQTRFGASLLPQWPVGVGGIGNEGVATFVQRTRFAIGYVEYAYARAHHLSDVSLRNHDGSFVQAQRETFRAAAEAGDWGDLAEFRQLATDSPGATSWPIVGASFILIPAAAEAGSRTAEVTHFFDWAVHHGGDIARKLDYEPIPAAAVEQLPALWRSQIHDGQSKPR